MSLKSIIVNLGAEKCQGSLNSSSYNWNRKKIQSVLKLVTFLHFFDTDEVLRFNEITFLLINKQIL